MWAAVKKGLLGLVGSRKFMAAVISAVIWGVGKFGVELDADELIPLVAPFWGYIAVMLGADWGKHAKEAEAAAKNGTAEEEPTPEFMKEKSADAGGGG